MDKLNEVIGNDLFNVFMEYKKFINSKYDMDETINSGGKRFDYEYKFRRGGKTLCCFYFKPGYLGMMVIFGGNERSKVESIRGELSSSILSFYDAATTYHDGKWVMFDICDLSFLPDMEKLLLVKRRFNKKVNDEK